MLSEHILLVRPARFIYNAQTAVNNTFQKQGGADTPAKALRQFDAFVENLQNHGIETTVLQDTPMPHTPDSIFPNNWISFHGNGIACLYPMFALNRQAERKALLLIKEKLQIKNIIDFTGYEKENKFLEGTGSMVLDRQNQVAYACLSPRTEAQVLGAFCKKMGYVPMTFRAADSGGKAIYHTNILMCVAARYAVICLESISPQDRGRITTSLTSTNKEIIEISLSQMDNFAGNMLQVQNKEGKPFIVMSQTAYKSLLPAQIAALKKYNDIIYSDISVIETNGGGSARCMMAEVF